MNFDKLNINYELILSKISNKRSATAYKPQNGQTFHVQNITNRGIFVWKIVHLSLGLL